MRCRFLAVVLLSSQLPAHADDLAEQAYAAGAFVEAKTYAEQEVVSADSLAFQARSLLAECLYLGHVIDQNLTEAEDLSRLALKIDPSHLEARFQLAVAMSLQARSLGIWEIDEQGIPERTNELTDYLLERDPDNAWVHGFMAVWHVEGRRKAGAFLSGFAGISLKDAEMHYQLATQLDPENLVLQWQYGRALAALNAKKYADEIEAIMRMVISREASDALEERVKVRAAELNKYVAAADYQTAEDFAAALL
ncbi:MAG: hypothetical protein CMK07_11425 [Ponticaulis sp.]|nr:hypothetical protein [Ponticaulis sp.]